MQDDFLDDERPRSATSDFLSPGVCAVAAFTLAVVALLGQNAISVGIGSVLSSELDDSAQAFYLGWALAIGLQVSVVLLLAGRTLSSVGSWEGVLGRAAVVVALVALVAGALVAVGGLRGSGGLGV